MSIARANGEQWSAPRQDSDFLEEVEREFLRLVPNGRKYLILYQMRILRNWSWREIGEGLKLSRGHCSRVFRQTQSRIEALRQEKFAGVARLRLIRDDDAGE